MSDPGGTVSGLFKSQNPTDYTKLDTGEYVNKITGETISATDFGNLASRSGSGIQRLTRGLQGGLFGTEGMAGGVTAMPGQSVDDIANSVPGAATRVERLRASGMSDADIMKDLQFSGYAPQNVTGGFTDQAGNVYSQQQMMDAGLVNSAGQLVSQVAGQFMPTGQQQGGGFLSGLMGGQGGGMLGAGIRAEGRYNEKNNPRSKTNDPTGLYAEGLTTGSRNNNNMSGGDGNNNTAPTQVATNVGGTIVTAPSSAEVSQSKATDVTYDSRKTKAKGRSMTILTSARGVRNNTNAVLGTKSLLGRA